MEDAGMEGTPAEEEIDYSSDERMKLMIQHISESLETFDQEAHWKSDHYQKLNAFLSESEQRVLFFWTDFDDATVLRVSDDQAPKFYDQGIRTEDFQVVFFIKKIWNVPISFSNLQECVQFRLIGTDPLADLLEKMQTEYVKKLLGENDWPDGVKKDFIMNLHKFMAFLNETTYAARG
jgi:dynein heavy chain